MLTLRNLSVVLTSMFLLTIYFRQVPTGEEVKPHRYVVADGGGAAGNFVKKIVAYSLKKRMEIESEPITCNNIIEENNTTHPRKKIRNKLPGTEFNVFSIHEDKRLHPYDYVRVLGMVKGNWKETLYCNVRSKNGKTHVTKAIRTDIWADNWVDEDASANYKPVLISCQIPTRAGPLYLHLSRTPCETGDRTILLHITSKNKTAKRSAWKKKVTICVKPLNFSKDITQRLLEWILMNEILGANKIEIYVRKVHQKTLNFLNWYANNGGAVNIKVIKDADLILQPESNLWQKRKNEILIYNHCFYENLDTDYILPIDIDEIIIPKEAMTWQEIFPEFPEGYASYLVRNSYFLLGTNHTNENRIFKTFERTIFSNVGDSGKSFVSTRDALTVFNHYALHALRPGIGRCHFLAEDLVQMNHYKETCPLDLLPECVKYLSSPRIYDDNVLKYKKLFDFRYFNLTKYYRL